MHVKRDALERLRLAIEDADILDLQNRRIAGGARRAFGDIDSAAEIDAADGGIARDFLGRTFGDTLAQIHGENPVRQRGHALDVVVDQEHGPPVGAEIRDQPGKGIHFARG